MDFETRVARLAQQETKTEALLANGYSLPPGFWRDVLQAIDGKTRGLPPRRVERDAPP